MSFNKCMLHTLHYSLHSPVISNLIRHKHSAYGIKFVTKVSQVNKYQLACL